MAIPPLPDQSHQSSRDASPRLARIRRRPGAVDDRDVLQATFSLRF
jgi:hypothetical protein